MYNHTGVCIYIYIYLFIYIYACVCNMFLCIYKNQSQFCFVDQMFVVAQCSNHTWQCFPLSFNGNIDIESHGIFPLQNDKSLTLKVVMRGTSNRSLSFERASLATFRKSFNQKYPCFTWGYSEDIDSWGYHD